MKKIVLALMLILLSSAGIAHACAHSIYDLQTDPALTGSLTPTCGIVTAIYYNGFFLQEEAGAVNPNGEYSGIWVYTGGDPVAAFPTLEVGGYASVCGVLVEYNGLTELDTVLADLYGYVRPLPDEVFTPLSPSIVTAADLAADGEPWESVWITIEDGMTVPVGFDLGYGEWNVEALDGTGLVFDDFWYDFGMVMEGQCYNNATGIYYYSYGAFKLEPFVDGIPIVDCAVGIETVSLSTIKAMFR